MTFHGKTIGAGLVVFLSMFLATDAYSDILFRGKQPIKIGRATEKDTAIEWTDCSSGKRQVLQKPAYNVDKTENCNVSDRTFGLQCEGDPTKKTVNCNVVDEVMARRYLSTINNRQTDTVKNGKTPVPAINNGQAVRFRIQTDSVQFRVNGTTLRIDR